MAGLFSELKRRNVVRVGVAYIVVGWVAIQIAQLLFEAFGTPPWVIKTVIVLVAIGFPFAVLFAWAFELTPEGLKKTREVDQSTSITHNTGRKLDFFIIGAMGIALIYFVWERQVHEHDAGTLVESVAEVTEGTSASDVPADAAPLHRSIAVLPFLNMSSDQEQQWFADGLTEEILNSLAKTPDLLVASRTTSFSFKGSDLPITDIASRIGVDHVLEGSVRRGGDTLRITAQLIRASDGFHLWSETFDRTMDDIISIQEEIAVQIANALETAMNPEALADMMDVGTSSVAAYEAYLTAQGAIQQWNESGDGYVILKGKEAFERAVEIDPQFSAAYFRLYLFWLSEGASSQLTSGLTELPPEQIRANIDRYLNLAIETVDDPVEKLSYEAAKANQQIDYRREIRLLAQFIDARPNSEGAWAGLMESYANLGMRSAQAELIRERYEAFEFSQRLANSMLQQLRDPGAMGLLREVANKAVEKFGDQAGLMYQAHRAFLWSGDYDVASRLVPQIEASQLSESNIDLVRLRQACADLRLTDAERLLNGGLEKFPDDLSFQYLGLQTFGDVDGAHEVFDRFDQEGDFRVIAEYLSYAHFDPTRYPNFMARYAAQRFEDRELLEVPFRCNR